MGITGLKSVFLRKAPPLSAEVLQKIKEFDFTHINSIVIKTNLSSDTKYPFSTDDFHLYQFLQTLMSVFRGKVIILDSGSNDHSIEDIFKHKRKLLQDFDVTFVNAEEDEQIKMSNPHSDFKAFNFFYLPRTWVTSDLRINFANVFVHKHHLDSQYFGLASNLLGLLSREYYKVKNTKKNIRSLLLRKGLENVMYDLLHTLNHHTPFITFADANYAGVTDEHSFFLKSKKIDIVEWTHDLHLIEKNISEKIGLLYYPTYLTL